MKKEGGGDFVRSELHFRVGLQSVAGYYKGHRQYFDQCAAADHPCNSAVRTQRVTVVLDYHGLISNANMFQRSCGVWQRRLGGFIAVRCSFRSDDL